jgi:hypothetical protein
VCIRGCELSAAFAEIEDHELTRIFTNSRKGMVLKWDQDSLAILIRVHSCAFVVVNSAPRLQGLRTTN